MKIGLLGTGKIGSVLVESIIKNHGEEITFYISKRSEKNSSELAQQFANVQIKENNQEIVDCCQWVLIALKNDILEEEISKLSFQEEQKVISVASNTAMEVLKRAIVGTKQISRMIPLPSMVYDMGAMLVYQQIEGMNSLFSGSGRLVECQSEKEFDALVAVSALIAPYYSILNQMAESAVKHGANKETAVEYTAALCSSLAEMALIKKLGFQELAREASTPGGLNEFSDEQIRKAGCYEAFEETYDKIIEMF